MDLILAPLFSALSRAMPETSDLLDGLVDNYDFW